MAVHQLVARRRHRIYRVLSTNINFSNNSTLDLVIHDPVIGLTRQILKALAAEWSEHGPLGERTSTEGNAGKLHVQDRTTLARLAEELTQGRRIDLAPALGMLANRSEALARKELPRLDRVFAKFESEKIFWR